MRRSLILIVLLSLPLALFGEDSPGFRVTLSIPVYMTPLRWRNSPK